MLLWFLGVKAHAAPNFKQVLNKLRQQCDKASDKDLNEGLAS